MTNVEDSKRLLIWHGMFLLLLRLLTGVVEQQFNNPRMGLARTLGRSNERDLPRRVGSRLDGVFPMLIDKTAPVWSFERHWTDLRSCGELVRRV
jgi:hypothetical protein